MMDHTTGVIDYDAARYPDAYLASQGVRPSVYSPVVGNEATMTPGGYPAVAGVPSGQPILPSLTAATEAPMYAEPNDAKGGYYAKPPIGVLAPGMPVRVLDMREGYEDGLVQVALGAVGGQQVIGLVPKASLQSADAAPTASPAAPTNPVQPTGGLAGIAGGVAGALGGAVQALGEAVSRIIPTKGPPTPEASYAPMGSKPGAAVTSDVTGQQIADLADDFAGVPYVHEFPTAADDPWQTGWDCSSFVKWLADSHGISDNQTPNQPGYVGGGVPTGSHYQWTWANANDRVVGTSWQDAQPGDAIYFNTDPSRERCNPENWNGCMDNDASHVGVYLGLDDTGRPKMIHAAAPGVGTVYDYLDTYPYPTLGVVRIT